MRSDRSDPCQERIRYTLLVAVYQVATNKVGFTRQAGFALIQQEQMVLSYVRQHGQIKRSEVMELCRLSSAMGC